MFDPEALYIWEPNGLEAAQKAAAESGDGLVLLYQFDGFIDAGLAGTSVVRHLLEEGDPRVVARFDTDQLIDYRTRRPQMIFRRDRWASVDAPELAVHLVNDATGTPFLVLSGPEPDGRWEAFSAAVRDLVDRLGVRLTVYVHGMPMSVPHTRPVGHTPHGTRRDLAAPVPAWFEKAPVPGSAAALLELRLGEAGYDVLGLGAHVPHYVTDSPYPAAAVVLLEAVQAATGLVLPSAGPRSLIDDVRAEIDAQLAEADELAESVRAMERQYDLAMVAMADTMAADDRVTGADLPTADELGRLFEDFLAEQDRGANG
ncbi:PAC2 family protein [Streptomyces sp. NPDC088725]|uniref:PAC2 family protein n=1 Tax=Streptomyces sp. NPDC088725 TaxID=3365873 RepID=UPI0038281FD6